MRGALLYIPSGACFTFTSGYRTYPDALKRILKKLELEFWEERKMNSNADPNIALIKTGFED